MFHVKHRPSPALSLRLARGRLNASRRVGESRGLETAQHADLDTPAARATRSARSPLSGTSGTPAAKPPVELAAAAESRAALANPEISIRPLRGLLDRRDRGVRRTGPRKRSRRIETSAPKSTSSRHARSAGYSIGRTTAPRNTRSAQPCRRSSRRRSRRIETSFPSCPRSRYARSAATRSAEPPVGRPVHATAAGYSIGGTACGSADGGADHARRLVEHAFADSLDTRI